MKESVNNNTWIVSCMLIVLIVSACTDKKTQTHVHDEYTCSMHPQVIQDAPGTCPICGMELVKKSNGGMEMVITEDMKDLIKPTNASVVASLETVHPERKTLLIKATVPGIISYDTRSTFDVPVRFGGRIEKLYLKYNYQPVKKGQVIMEIYSPELVTAQRELLFVASEDPELLDAAKQKLLLLGLTSDQIDRVIATGKETFSVSVLSPHSGYIAESTVSAPGVPPESTNQSSAMNGEGMSNGVQAATSRNTPSTPSPGSQFSVREGMYVTTGQSLFKVVDNARIWAELNFSIREGRQIRKGDPIELYVNGSNEAISSQADFIQPFINEGEQFLTVRSYLHDDRDNLRVGQLVTAHVNHYREGALWVPVSAILDLGVQQVVFLKNERTFSPFKVKTGLESDGWTEVIEGLSESSEIAVNAQYLVDSESFIKVMNP